MGLLVVWTNTGVAKRIPYIPHLLVNAPQRFRAASAINVVQFSACGGVSWVAVVDTSLSISPHPPPRAWSGCACGRGRTTLYMQHGPYSEIFICPGDGALQIHTRSSHFSLQIHTLLVSWSASQLASWLATQLVSYSKLQLVWPVS